MKGIMLGKIGHGSPRIGMSDELIEKLTYGAMKVTEGRPSLSFSLMIGRCYSTKNAAGSCYRPFDMKQGSLEFNGHTLTRSLRLLIVIDLQLLILLSK